MIYNNILVTGGTGKTGRKIVNRLLQKNINVRVGSRGNNPAFDWNNKETWAQALSSMDAVYISYQPDLAVPGAKEAIEDFTKLAVESGVKKFVLLSGKGEKEAELCEQIVMDSGIAWTVVRASWFNQNFSESFFLDPILAGNLALPKAEALIPFIDTDDIADVVVEAFIDSKHSGNIYELTGPRQLTFQQAVEEISEATGREINFTPITMIEYKTIMQRQNIPPAFIWLVEYLFTEVLVEKNSVVTNDVEKVLGRKAIDFKEYAGKVARTGLWDVPVSQELQA